jgi:ABC-type transport system substrate-binding protein
MQHKARTWGALLALTLATAACGGDDGGGAGAGAGAGGGEFSVYIIEPQHISPPSNVTETSGAEVLNALYAPLVEYDLENAAPLMGDDAPTAIAESIESEDNRTYTITLKEGWTFHNGEPVTAQSYIDAWNYGAYATNANTGAFFFEKIEGYDALQCSQTDAKGSCVGQPSATEMTGLQVVDDRTFTVRLREPFSIWPLVLGYTAFNPVPAAFLDDPGKYVEQPVGTGPFMMDGPWEHNRRIRVTRYDGYAGPAPKADAVEFRIYSEMDTAYNDLLAGDLDVMDRIPPAQVASAQQEFSGRFLRETGGSYQFIGFPLYDRRFTNPDLRKAFSLAIDREAIANAVRPDFVPATGFVNPRVPGAVENHCGGNCEFDPDEAKRLFEQAGGFEGTLMLYFNSGAGHDVWIEAVANQLRQNLGIENIEFRTLDFAEYLPLLQSEGVEGPYRLGWVPDYPSPQTYLEPVHATGASSNYTGYASEEFDSLVEQGNTAASLEEGLQYYEQAQEVLAADMPHMPMFFQETQVAWSDRVSGVDINFSDEVNVAEIEVVG